MNEINSCIDGYPIGLADWAEIIYDKLTEIVSFPVIILLIFIDLREFSKSEAEVYEIYVCNY